MSLIFGAAIASLAAAGHGQAPPDERPAARPAAATPVLRVAVVNGLARRGPWHALANAFMASRSVRIETEAGQRESVVEAFKTGRADMALMHTGAEADALVKAGFTAAAVPWAASGFVLAGPKTDPAGVRGAPDAAAAMRLILTKQAPFIDPDGQGTRVVYEQTLTKSGMKAPAGWQPVPAGPDALATAMARSAYLIVPSHREGLAAAQKNGLELFVSNDPALRTEFVALIATKSSRAAEAATLLKFLGSKEAAPLFRHKPPDPSAAALELYPLLQPK